MYSIRKDIPFYVYYQENNLITLLDENNEIKTITKVEKIKLEDEYNFFEMFQCYEPTEQSMIKFKKDLIKWNEQTSNYKFRKIQIDYASYRNNDTAVLCTFRRFCEDSLKSIKPERVTYNEHWFMGNCHNGGLCYFDYEYKDKLIDCYGSDYSGFYTTILGESDFQIAIKQGKRKRLKT